MLSGLMLMETAAHHLQQPYCSPSSPTGNSFHQPCSCCKDCNESSTTSTPYVSAPSSPRRSTALGYYLARSAFTISSDSKSYDINCILSAGTEAESPPPFSSDFDFSARFSEADSGFSPSTASTMSSAEELFCNGKIRPLNTSSYCICFNGTGHDGYCNSLVADAHACCQYAHTDGKLPSSHAEQNHHHHHQQQQQQQQPPPRRKQRLGHTKPTSPLSALEEWKKSMGKYDTGHAHAQPTEREMQIYSSLPLACYSNGGGGHHRRARSLSPLRVFHMDDMMQPRISFESEIYTNMSSHAAMDQHDVGIIRPRRSRKSWTLKELLNMGDNKVHDRRPQLGGEFNYLEPCHDNKYGNNIQMGNVQPAAKSGEKGTTLHDKLEEKMSFMSAGDEMGKRSLAKERTYSKSSTHSEGGTRSPWQKAMVGHAEHYYNGSQRANAEEMKKRTFLPYKKGLLGCLGFTSKLSSIKGFQHAMNPNPS